MRYEIKNWIVTFYLENPRRATEDIVSQSFANSNLTEQQITPLVESLMKKFRGQALGSQKIVTSGFLRPFFAYFQTTGYSWPTTSAEWQLNVYRFFQFYLVDTSWSKSRTSFRMRMWQSQIGVLLGFLIEDEVIPLDVRIPKIEQRKIRSLSREQPLLCQHRANLLNAQPKKLLVDINFGMADAEYLDAVEMKCRHLVGVIQNSCLAHWNALMHDCETGRRLSESVTNLEIEEAIATERYQTIRPESGKLTRYASPLHPQGHAWALAIVRQNLANGTDTKCVSLDALRASPFFPKRLFFTSKEHETYIELENITAMNREQWQALPLPARFYRFAGLLSNLDAAAACCLLTLEHPQFTSESLQEAQLLNVRGKSYLLLTDSHDHSILSLDKPRAGRRKSVVLTSTSQKLVLDILRCTAPVREVLKRAGDKTWRYLFLGVKKHYGANGFLGIVEGSATFLTGGQGVVALTTLYPTLSQNGLIKGGFDYRRLRNTLGVLRWFETGSILEMSRHLGNTRKVALEHYLPPALLHAWNTRIIRRFQNSLIVLAAHDEPYLLEVTDFSNMADLQHFIAQIIMDYPARTSPLADEAQRRLYSGKQPKSIPMASTPGILNIRLSPKSLGLLYSYSNLALRTLAPDALDKIDGISGLSPRQFTNMATLLRHAAECNKIHVSLRETLDVPLLKQVHGEALAIQVDIDAQFTKLAIKHCWAESP